MLYDNPFAKDLSLEDVNIRRKEPLENVTYFIHFKKTRVDFPPVRDARRDRI
jgi:hypothetical protein